MTSLMRQRDKNYICDRLLVPANGAVEAIDRLRQNYEYGKAQEISDALKVFMDVCRKIRYEIEEPS